MRRNRTKPFLITSPLTIAWLLEFLCRSKSERSRQNRIGMNAVLIRPGAGLSHMEFPLQHPLLGPMSPRAIRVARWNRMGNRAESKPERSLPPFAKRRAQSAAWHWFFPYAIPLPASGRGLGWVLSASAGAHAERNASLFTRSSASRCPYARAARPDSVRRLRRPLVQKALPTCNPGSILFGH
jgi:hypothetical protein